MSNKNTKLTYGFTLVELMISIAVFSSVMVASMGSIFVMLNSNRKSEAVRTILDNMSYTMDDMVRAIRFGSIYHCGSSFPLNIPNNCNSGDTTLTFVDSSGTQITYKLVSGQIVRTIGGVDYFLTSGDANIQSLTFFVLGATTYVNGDFNQPKVIIVIKGTAGVNTISQTPFLLETTVSQRKLDL
jgi:prepilin-type N-terminal cleavage/methylation domain-containing protein